MKENIILHTKFEIAIRIVDLYKNIQSKMNEFILCKQILHFELSVATNIKEYLRDVSKKDFIHKPTISYKERRENIYWQKLLHVTQYFRYKELISYRMVQRKHV